MPALFSLVLTGHTKVRVLAGQTSTMTRTGLCNQGVVNNVADFGEAAAGSDSRRLQSA